MEKCICLAYDLTQLRNYKVILTTRNRKDRERERLTR